VRPSNDSPLRRGPRLLAIPRFSDHRGNLSVIDWPGNLSFTPRRFYYIYDVTRGSTRAGHAHFVEEELIICLAGSVVVVADDGRDRREFSLNRPDFALHIPPLVWHELRDFSPGAVCAVLASEPHFEKDYCRVYQEFLRVARQPLR
jgi:dTDP-4-dehydrorhamnose 3,5-epimerase-like enzyme